MAEGARIRRACTSAWKRLQTCPWSCSVPQPHLTSQAILSVGSPGMCAARQYSRATTTPRRPTRTQQEPQPARHPQRRRVAAQNDGGRQAETSYSMRARWLWARRVVEKGERRRRARRLAGRWDGDPARRALIRVRDQPTESFLLTAPISPSPRKPAGVPC
jgi:hypothetical protein